MNLRVCKYYIGLCFFVFSTYRLPGQNVKFEHFTIDDGLSQNTVSLIYQDYKGFIWVGTFEGINRFDGEKILSYKNYPGDTTSLSANRVRCIFEDKEKQLWIGTENGLDRFDRNKDRFEHFYYNPNDPGSISSNVINSIAQDSKGTIWLALEEGINQFNPRTGKFTYFDADSLNLYRSCIYATRQIIVDKEDNIWFGTLGCGVDRYNPSNGEFTHFQNDPVNNQSLSNNLINTVFEDSDGNIWVGTNNGLNKFDAITNTFTRFLYNYENPDELSYNKINSIAEQNGVLWIATENGVALLDKNKNEISFITNDPYNPESLSDNRSYVIYIDNIGSIWIGTWTGGVNLYNKSVKKFTHYKNNPYDKNSLSSNKVYSINEDYQGNIWLATFKGGLNCFNPKTKRFTQFKSDKNNPNSLIDDDVWIAIEDREGNIWAGTSNGLSVLDRDRRSIKHFRNDPGNPASLCYNVVWALHEDHAGDIWVGTTGGLSRYNKTTNKFTNYYSSPIPKKDNISHSTVNCISDDHLGNIWVGTSRGIDVFNYEEQHFVHFIKDTSEHKGIIHEIVVSIFEDSEYNMWIGTEGGLNMLDKKSNRFIYYTEKDGLPNNVIYSIREDDHGNLWMSTNRGLSRFDFKNGTFRNYDVSDGLQSNEFNYGSCKSGEGKMYFCGINGFNEFHPDSVFENIIPPEVVFTGFKLFNKDCFAGKKINGRIILPQDITETKEIELTYRDQVITIEFAALNYICSWKNKYSYKMEGFENDWNYVGNRNFATYTNLPHGKYTFRVKASNNDGVWNEQGAALTIVVIPPFWRTTGFKIFIVLLISAIIVVTYKTRINNIQVQKLKLEELVEERTRELQDAVATKNKFFSIIAHDLKNSFYALLGFSELLLKNADSYDQYEVRKFSQFIYKSSRNLFNLLENLLQWSKSQIGTIRFTPVEVNLNMLVKNTITVLKPNADKKNINIVSKIEEGCVVYGDSEMIRVVVRNLLDNAIKFTRENGEVRISSHNTGKVVEVSVKDNGVGIDSDNIDNLFKIDVNPTNKGTSQEKGTGLGLILCKEFVERHGGLIWVESTPNEGSVFKFTLPLKEEQA